MQLPSDGVTLDRADIVVIDWFMHSLTMCTGVCLLQCTVGASVLCFMDYSSV